MREKKEKAEYLFSEIGGIDDKFIGEAQSYKPTRRAYIPISAIAACLVVCITAVLIATNAGIFDLAMGSKNEEVAVGKDEHETERLPSVSGNDVAEAPDAMAGLDMVFLSCVNSGEYSPYSSMAELLAERGQSYIIWKHIDSENIYISRPLDKSETEDIEKYLGKGECVGEISPKNEFLVWILNEHGEIRSPYLEDTVGNVGNYLFDYEAEIIPADEFVNIISSIIN